MARDKITIQHRFELIGWNLVSGLLRLLSRRATVHLADGAGWLFYHLFRVRRHLIDSQLAIAFPDESSDWRQRTGCRSWQNSILTFFEFLRPQSLAEAGGDDFADQEGFDEYARPLKTNPGNGLLVTGHLGNWEAMGRMAIRENVRIAAVAKPMHNPLINDVINSSRHKTGLELLMVKGNMKGIVDAAKQGKWVAFVGDQDARRRGMFIDFFGRPASTAGGPAYFAYTLNLPLLPVYCVRRTDALRGVKLIVHPPIWPDLAADREEEILRLTKAHTASLEQIVRQHPEDYFWLHNRWKTRPKVRKGHDSRNQDKI